MSRRFLVLCSLATASGSLHVQGHRTPRLVFQPADSTFAQAARSYDSLWRADGERMSRAVEQASGLRFTRMGDTLITVIVFEGVSHSGDPGTPMRLRASYPTPIRKAALMHELGHRLQSGLVPPGGDEHGVLFLWLYRAWEEAWGEAFAREQVAVERGRGGVYPAAWDASLSLSAETRAARWIALRDAALARGRP